MASNHPILSSFLSIVATTGLVAMASPARADTSNAHGSQRIVRSADLDLNSDAGRTTLAHRIAAAASQVCDTQMRGVASIDHDCREAAITQARRDAGLDEVAQNG